MKRLGKKYDSKQKFASFVFVVSYILAYSFCSYALHDFDCMEWARIAIDENRRDINPFSLIFVPLLIFSFFPIIGGIVLLVHYFVEMNRRRRIIAACGIGLFFPILSLSEAGLAHTTQSLMVSLVALLIACTALIVAYTICVWLVRASRYPSAAGRKA